MSGIMSGRDVRPVATASNAAMRNILRQREYRDIRSDIRAPCPTRVERVVSRSSECNSYTTSLICPSVRFADSGASTRGLVSGSA